VAAFCACLPFPVFGQSPPPRAIGLETIVVDGEPRRSGTEDVQGFVARSSGFGTKTDTPLIETPRSISVVTANEIEARGAQTVTEALQYSAGFNGYYLGTGTLREYPYIRGFLGYQYLDGLKLHDSNWSVEPYGLERAELLRGPASILFGQAQPGGIINLVSKRPTSTPFREVILQTGSYGRIQAAFDIGGPVGTSKEWSYRLTGLGRSADGQINVTNNDRVYIAPAITWRPTDATSLTLLGSYQHDPKVTLFQPLPRIGTIVPSAFGYVSRKTFLGEPNFHDTSRTAYRIGYEFEHRFDDAWTFRQKARYGYYDISAADVQGAGSLVNARTIRRSTLLADYAINMGQVDTQLETKFNTGAASHRVLFGVDFAWIPNYQGSGGATTPNLDLYNPVYGTPLGSVPRITTKRWQNQTQLGAYLQDQVKIGNLSLLFGGRFDNASLSNHPRSLNTATGTFGGPVTSFNDQAFTKQFGAIYNFDNGIAPYVSYSESFYPTINVDFFGNSMRPTRGKQYEAGVKYQPPSWNTLLTASVFDLTQKNVVTGDPLHPGYAIQTGEVKSRGVEFEIKASPLANLNLTAAYSFLDNETTKTNTVANRGKALPGNPGRMASLWADYRFEGGQIRGLTIGGGLKWVGNSFGDAANTFKVPNFTIVDAAIRYDLGVLHAGMKDWELSATATNIFDKRYVSTCLSDASCYYGDGRTVLASLKMRW
jgi:iron complex outermembrane receptor protein